MKKALICSLVCVLALAVSAAQAEIVVTWTYTANVAQAVDGTWLDKYVMTADAGTGSVISAIEAGKAGNYSGTIVTATGFSGTFYNEWPDYDPPGPAGVTYVPTPLSKWMAGATEMDSPTMDTHFLVTPNSVVYAAEENYSGDVGLLGNGDYALWCEDLMMTAGFANQTQVMNIAQFYVEAGTDLNYDVQIAASGQDKLVISGVAPIPEPSVLCLLGLGSLAMVLIRRR